MTQVKATLIVAAVVIAAGLGLVLSEVFDIAADTRHWPLTHRLLEFVRETAITRAARNVGSPPALDDPKLIAAGAQEYAEMCTGCHLAPGMKATEMRTGLYPKPPNFALEKSQRPPAESFWIIKHGLKMTGMPAWGLTHDDQRLWSLVAFVQKLPGLSPTQYKNLVAQAGEEEKGPHEHSHEEGN